MESKKQQSQISYGLKEFVAQNLDRAAKLAAEMAIKVRSCAAEISVKQILTDNVPELISRVAIACQPMMPERQTWWTEKMMFSALIAAEEVYPEEFAKEIETLEDWASPSHGLARN